MKFVKRIAIIIIIGLFILGLTSSGLSYLLGFDYLEKEELTEVLMENWDLLNKTAVVLAPLFSEDMSFTTINNGILLSNTEKINLKHGLVLSTSNKNKDNWTQAKIDVIDNSKAYKILRKFEFVEISFFSNVGNCVFFDNRSNLGFTVSLAYCEDGEPQYEYMRSCEHITGNWYYCVTE